MEPNDSNIKPQPTGGLKLMTVFIAVLALHVVVIGGFTVWHLLYPSSVEGDLAADKAHKNKIASDTSIGELTSNGDATSDKTSGAAAAASEGETPAATEAPAPASTTPTMQAATAPASPAPAQAPLVVSTTQSAPDASSVAASPTGVVRNGPVVSPPTNLAPPTDTAATVAADPASTLAAADGTAYTVKKGDSLARIAHRHHVSVSNLRAANGLAGDGLHIGQKLTIPEKMAKASAVTTTVTPAVTPAAAPVAAPLAQPVQDSDMTGAVATGSSMLGALPKHTTHKTASTATHRYYTVVKGDTLTKIAKRYHTTTSAIMAANSLTNAGRLSIGQKLHIPSHESRAAATAEEATPPVQENHSRAKGQLANYTP